MPDGDNKENSNGDCKEDSLEQAMEQVMEQVWSKYGASMEQAIGQVILKETLKARNQKSDNTRYRDLSIINSNILIWISVKLGQYP